MTIYDFGPFRLDESARDLSCAGAPVPVGDRGFAILREIVRSGGEFISSQRLRALVWPHGNIRDEALRYQISMLRRLLSSASGADYLLNVPGRGYRLMVMAHSTPDMPEAPLARPPALVGRVSDQHVLLLALTDDRLVTLVGPGGVGKSELAQSLPPLLQTVVAQKCILIDMDAASSRTDVETRIAGSIGLQSDQAGDGNAIAEHLEGRSVLVLLDNCDAGIEFVADICLDLLRTSDDVKILATSREPLRVPGERVMRLRSLALPPIGTSLSSLCDHPASELYLSLTDEIREADEVVSVCEQSGGLPLAIVHAAGRTARSGADRHQSLEACNSWSLARLSPADKAVLEFLAGLEQPFNIEAALEERAAFMTPVAMADAVGRLVSKSIVICLADSGSLEYLVPEPVAAIVRRPLHEITS